MNLKIRQNDGKQVEVEIPEDMEEAKKTMDLCEMLGTHTAVCVDYSTYICSTCKAILLSDSKSILSRDSNDYQPDLLSIARFDGGIAYLNKMRSWILSTKKGGIATAYAIATEEFSDELEGIVKANGNGENYVRALINKCKCGKARSAMLNLKHGIYSSYVKKYYFDREVEYYNAIARSVTKRREQLNAINVKLREDMKGMKGAERQHLVDMLEDNIATRKRLKDVERKAYKTKMDIRLQLGV